MLHEKFINLIVAMDPNGLIGKQNELPWPKIRADMKRFKQHTENRSVIMGRRTWESLPKEHQPLSDRENIVLSRNPSYTAKGAVVQTCFEQAVQQAVNSHVFVMGGREIYKLALPFATILNISHIGIPFDGDVYFPEYDKSEWRCTKAPGALPIHNCATKSGLVIPVCFAIYYRIRAAP